MNMTGIWLILWVLATLFNASQLFCRQIMDCNLGRAHLLINVNSVKGVLFKRNRILQAFETDNCVSKSSLKWSNVSRSTAAVKWLNKTKTNKEIIDISHSRRRVDGNIFLQWVLEADLFPWLWSIGRRRQLTLVNGYLLGISFVGFNLALDQYTGS